MPGLGKIQRRIRRAFIANPGALLTTADLIRWCYPRAESVDRIHVWRVTKAVADRVGRTYPGGFIWREKPSQSLPKTKMQDD